MQIKTTVLALLAVTLLAVGCGGDDIPMNEQPPAEAEASDSSAAPESTHSAQGYLSCWDYDGTSCSRPGTYFTCYNQYPYEPGICYCGSDYVRSCG